MGGGGRLAAGVHGRLDQVVEHPQGVRRVRGEDAGRADGGRVVERGLEILLTEGGQAADVGGVGADDPGSARRRPGVHLPGGVDRLPAVAAGGGEQRQGEPAGPGQQVVAVGRAQLEPLVDQLPGLVPAAGVEGVLPEQEQRLDGGGDRAARTAVLDRALQGLAARRQPVQVGDGDAGAGDAGRVDLLAEVGDGGIDARQHGRGETGRIAERPGEDLKQLGRARAEPVDGAVESRPQVGPAAEETDHDQGVERLDEDDVVGVERVVQLIDGGNQQPVGGVDVAVAVQQVIRARDGGLDRAAGAGVGAAGLLEQARSVAQVAGHDRAHVRGLRQPSAPALGGGAELRRAQQLGDGADGVASPQAGVGELLKERGDPRVGFLGRLREVPGVSLWLVG